MDTALQAQSAPRAAATAAPAVYELARRLLSNGVSPGLARRIVTRVEALSGRGDLRHPLDLAADVIGASFPRVVLRTRRDQPVALALLGARAAGRTSLLRKLVLRMRDAGRKPAVLAVRQPGSSKPEWLAGWLDEMGLNAEVVDAGAALPRRALRGASLVLVDGAGDPGRDEEILAALGRGGLGRPIAATRVAVLAADAAPERVRADVRALRGLAPDCSVLTRIDLCDAPAAAFEICSDAGLPVAFACDGARDERHLHRLDPDRAADLFLKGKLS